MYLPSEPKRQLYRVDFPPGGGLQPEPIRNAPRGRALGYVNSVNGARVRDDGTLTTIREFVGDHIADQASARGINVDELVCALPHGPEGRCLIGGGYSIVSFTWQPLVERMSRSRCWAAYLVVTPHGLEVMQSA